MNPEVEKLVKVSPLRLNGEVAKDIAIFRKILELSMKKFLWNGLCGQS